MATNYELEVDSEAYASLWLTQTSFSKQHAEQFKKISQIDEIDGIFRKPRISVWTFSHVDNFKFVVGCHNECKIVSSEASIKMSEDITRPRVVVVMLSPRRQQGICHLSKEDLKLLCIVSNTSEHPDNIIYLVKASDDDVICDTEELEKLSDKIHRIINKSSHNEIFKKLFLLQDDQVSVRIGMCLLNSLTRIINRVHHNVQVFNGSLNNKLIDLVNNKNYYINIFEKFISKSGFKICNLASQTSNRVKMRNLIKLLKKEIERKDLLVGVKISKGNKNNQIGKVGKNLETRFGICLQKRKSFLRKEQFHIHNGRTPKYSSTRFTRSMTKEVSILQNSKTTKALDTKKDINHICLTRCSNIFCRNDFKEMAEEVYTELLNSSTKFVHSYTEDLAAFSKIISDERLKRAYSLKIHEWKTVAMRNVLVKGFGCVENNMFIYLKTNDEDEKFSISEYAKKYLSDPPDNYKLKLIYKQRKITLFSKLEQGSKINRKETVQRPDKPRKYGSVGMFLEDKHGKFFFTTCAHVIGKKEYAYSPDDNSILGRNVYINHSDRNENDKKHPYIDFSLVQVSTERTLTCTFGLKTIGGNFKNGLIFRGDLSEILKRNVYKWGATSPFLRQGKCIGFEDEGSILCLMVDTKDFAEEGDSGAIVCVGENVETGLAAFVIVGGSQDDSTCENASNSERSYLVYKVSDALDKVSGMKPCLIPSTTTISISSSNSDSIQSTSKRKRHDDV